MAATPGQRWPRFRCFVVAMLAECPVWIPEARLLAWVDILGPTYNLLDPSTGINRAIPVHAKIGSAAPLDAGEAILALEDGLWLFRQGQPLASLPSPDMTGVHFNDGKCDPAGRFWVGTRATDGSPGGGALYRVGWEREDNTIRPQPAPEPGAAIFSAKNSPRPPSPSVMR